MCFNGLVSESKSKVCVFPPNKLKHYYLLFTTMWRKYSPLNLKPQLSLKHLTSLRIDNSETKQCSLPFCNKLWLCLIFFNIIRDFIFLSEILILSRACDNWRLTLSLPFYFSWKGYKEDHQLSKELTSCENRRAYYWKDYYTSTLWTSQICN